MKPTLIALGVMTGNSLDAVDTVITRFTPTGGIHDLFHHSLPFPPHLAEQIRSLKEALRKTEGSIAHAENEEISKDFIDTVHQSYIKCVALACRKTVEAAHATNAINSDTSIDIIGFHGQTCAHNPPSLANTGRVKSYTVQLGDGQMLADAIGMPVAYDFRSDDIMHGGEGAPLAPMHHYHIAIETKSKGIFPIAFINGGNTGNVSIITHQSGQKDLAVLGWDTGPFNHFPDLLAQREAHKPHDTNGEIGILGAINTSLLRLLFTKSVITNDGSNFMELPPPRSCDPQWYRHDLPELLGTAPVDGQILSLADRMRTAEYFAAYLVMLSLALTPHDCEFPHFIGLCGGGWRNPVTTTHFRHLIQGSGTNVILTEHAQIYAGLLARIGKRKITIESTSAFGFDGSSMEARIFADAAVRLVWGAPFTRPSITGVKEPTVCGRIRFPAGRDPHIFTCGKFMADAGTLLKASSLMGFTDHRFGRAIRGWRKTYWGGV